MGETAHGIDEVVRGAVAVAVGQDNDWFLPANAVAGVDVDGFWFGELTVARTRFVLNVASQGAFVGEVLCHQRGVDKGTATILPYIDDEAVADG